MTTITIGRSSANTIVVDASYNTVSSNHATITEHNGTFTLQDHSTNGTYVNGQFVHNQSVHISQGDIISLGKQYTLNWREVMQYVGGSQATQRFPQTQRTNRDAQYRDPQIAQQININVAGNHNEPAHERRAPQNLNNWNWGAFLLGWIWGIGNGVYWPLVILIPYVGQIALLIIIFILGANGNRYAWEKFSGTAEEFEAKQKSWTKAAVIVLIVSVVVGFLIGLAIVASF